MSILLAALIPSVIDLIIGLIPADKVAASGWLHWLLLTVKAVAVKIPPPT